MPTPPDFTNATALDASSLNKIGFWLVKTQVVGTAVSTVTVTNAFSADFDNYRVIYDGGTASADGAFNVQLGATATGYHYSIVYQQFNAATPLGVGAANTTAWLNAGRHSTVRNSLVIDIFNPYLSTYSGIRYSGVDYLATTGYMITGGGILNNTTSYTDLKINPGLGTITGGTIRVYGFRN